MIVAIANQQSRLKLDRPRLRRAIRGVLTPLVPRARISLAVVDDPTMHRLNRQFLNHDYPTDVLSFLLDRREGFLEGEIIVSADTAAREGPRHRLSADEELCLYVIHGTLHLAGYDDHAPADRARMRAQERAHLAASAIPARKGKPRAAAPGRRRTEHIGRKEGRR